EMPFLSLFYHITLTNVNYMDIMTVEVELTEESLTDDMTKLQKMTSQLSTRLKDVLNIKAEVKIVLPGTLQRFEGKSNHVTDNRKYD
ncbi:MAG: phenylacetate--CoA ligase, partial [Candidatus Methanomethylophilaceae archaeon]|nr:phenylacetate--CoA ligase [Candidatus Methanomethylophilaceae archaeon]